MIRMGFRVLFGVHGSLEILLVTFGFGLDTLQNRIKGTISI